MILFGEDVSHLIYTEEFINYNRVTVLGQKVKHCMRRLLISCASINLSDYVADHVPHENIWAYFATQDFQRRVKLTVFVQCFVSLTQKSRFLFEPCHRCVYECSNTTWCVYMILADGSLKTLHSMCRLKIYNNGLATFHEWVRGVLPKKSSENVVRSTILIYNTGFDLIICIEKRSWEGKKMCDMMMVKTHDKRGPLQWHDQSPNSATGDNTKPDKTTK